MAIKGYKIRQKSQIKSLSGPSFQFIALQPHILILKPHPIKQILHEFTTFLHNIVHRLQNPQPKTMEGNLVKILRLAYKTIPSSRQNIFSCMQE